MKRRGSSSSLCTFLIWMFMLVLPSVANSTARNLDKLLQSYAYKAFTNPKTGITYDGAVPHNLSGIGISAMRLRSGSLRRRGIRRYKEFEIPTGVLETPYVERIVLVYHNFGNLSTLYYPPPAGHMYVAPVLGLLAYDASNLSGINLQELDILASGGPMVIHFRNISDSGAKCVYYSLQGAFNISNSRGNQCSSVYQGHFSMVIVTPSPSPLPSEEGKSMVRIIVGSAVGGGVLLLLLSACLVLGLAKYRHKKRMQVMETASEAGEPLQRRLVGSTTTHVAMGTRTQPVLESGYVP